MENKSIPISILMATYNGEKYLHEQLTSLLSQSHTNWKLWIYDDGSTDSTLSIINHFCTLDSRIHKTSSSKKNIGAGKAFFSLLAYSDTPYTIFCDQDDIWLDTKLEELLKYAEDKLDDSQPGMVYCDAFAYSNATKTIISQSVSHLHAKHLNEFLFFNSGYQGCSILFNHPLCIMAQHYTPEFYMHDDIISLIGHTFGNVYFLNKPLMLYRQHDNNVTGQTSRGYWDMVQGFFRSGASVLSQCHYEEKKEFFNHYRIKMSPKNISLFEAYLNFPNTSLIMRLWIILSNRFSIGGHQLILLLKTLLRKPLG